MLQQMEAAEAMLNRERRESEKLEIAACFVALIALAIMMFGLTMLYSTSYTIAGNRFFYTQLTWGCLGVIAAIGVVWIGYRKLGQYGWHLMILVMILLAIAAFVMRPINGANRWILISIGGRALSFQPSEMAKPVLALFAAKAISDHFRQFSDWRQWKVLLVPFGAIGLVLLLVLAGKDLGTTVLLASSVGLLAIFAGLQKRFWIIPLLVAVLGFFAIREFSPERLSRITSFTNPEAVREDDGYQLWNSLLALGSGNWTGIGFMESRMKQRYLPEAHTDFILAIVGEELGFIGIAAVIVAYLCFGWFTLQIALKARSRFGTLLAATIGAIILLQAAINLGVVSGALPTKGIPAPFISYGGSNLLMNMIMVGLLVSVALESVPGLTDRWWGRKSRQSSGPDSRSHQPRISL